MLGDVTIAYCQSNDNIAQKLEGILSSKGFQCDNYIIDTPQFEDPWKALISRQQPTIVLISDNFLKSRKALEKGLSGVKYLLSEEKALIIVVNGRYRKSDSLEYMVVATEFNSVSQVLNYMNFWQDQLQTLINKDKEIQFGKDDELLKEKQIVQRISSEIGEFLRLLRIENRFVEEDLDSENRLQEIILFLIEKTGLNQNSNDGITNADQMNQEPALTEEDLAMPKKQILDLSDLEPEIDINPEEFPGIRDLIHIDLDQQIKDVEKSSKDQVAKNKKKKMTDDGSDFIEPGGIAEMEVSKLNAKKKKKKTKKKKKEKQGEPLIDLEKLISRKEDEESVDTDIEAVHEKRNSIIVIEESIHLLEEGREDEVIELLKKAVKEDPHNRDLSYQYGALLAEYTDETDNAIEQFESILFSDPDNFMACMRLAELFERKGKFKKSIQYYQHVLRLNPQFGEVHYRLARIRHDGLKMSDKTTYKMYKEAGKTDPENADVLFHQGRMMLENFGKPHKAAKLFKRCLRLNHEHAEACLLLSKTYSFLTDDIKARKYYQRAIILQPNLVDRMYEEELGFEQKDENISFIHEEGNNIVEPKEESIELDLSKRKSWIVSEESDRSGSKIDVSEEERPDPMKVETSSSNEDRTILVTGATSGIGQAVSTIFAKAKYKLIITGRRIDRLKDLATVLNSLHGVQVLPLAFDIRDYNATKSAIDNLGKEWENIDILVNNAGLAKGFHPIQEGYIAHWETMIDTNIKGLLYITRLVTPGMVRRKSGHIINVCSTAGKEVYPNGNVYCATKHAVDALTHGMRLDLHMHGIKVSQVSPAHVEQTEFAKVRFDGDVERANIYDDFNPLQAPDVAEVIYFIASRPPHVNIQDVLLMGTQQASSSVIDRSGRIYD